MKMFFPIFIQVFSHKLLEKFNVCQNLDECLRRLDSNRRLAVAISLEHARNSRLIPASEIFCFANSNAILVYSLQILVRKGFPYLKELNTFINAARVSGLIDKWLEDTKIRADFQYKEVEFGRFTMNNFSAFFIIWISTAIVPCFTLFLENVVFHIARKQNSTKISLYKGCIH